MDPITFTPALIWDIILAAAIFICICVGLYRGLAATFVNLVGAIACIIVAAIFCKPIAVWAYDSFLAGRVKTATVQAVMEKLSGFTDLLQQMGLVDSISLATGDMTRKPTVALLTVLAFVLIYLVARLLIRLIVHLTKKVNGVPVIGAVNSLLGGALGALEGLLVCYIIALGVTLLISFSNNELSWINSGIVEKTRLLDWFIHIKLPFKL